MFEHLKESQQAQEETDDQENTEDTNEENEESKGGEGGGSDELDDDIAKLREENETLRRDRDNYKEGLLAVKKRKLEEKPEPQPYEEEIRTKVDEVLQEKNEQQVLKDVINPKSSNYMPELVKESQYQDILQYLPRKIDRTSQEGVVKALRIAVSGWKQATGFKDKAKDKASELATSHSVPSGRTNNEVSSPDRKRVIPKQTGPDGWYK